MQLPPGYRILWSHWHSSAFTKSSTLSHHFISHSASAVVIPNSHPGISGSLNSVPSYHTVLSNVLLTPLQAQGLLPQDFRYHKNTFEEPFTRANNLNFIHFIHAVGYLQAVKSSNFPFLLTSSMPVPTHLVIQTTGMFKFRNYLHSFLQKQPFIPRSLTLFANTYDPIMSLQG